MLHDAHLIKGGKAYMLTKCLITGVLRGQTLAETINYIKTYILINGPAICLELFFCLKNPSPLRGSFLPS